MDNELIGMQTEAEGAAAQVTEQPDTTGEQSADAALKHWVEDMKVPREKAERFLKAKSRQAAAAKTTAQPSNGQETRTITQPTEAQAEPESSTDAGQESTSGGQNSAARPSFDELIRDDEYKAAYQSNVENIVRERVAKLSGYKDAMKAVEPMLLEMATMLGQDVSNPEKLDYKAICEAFRSDPENYRKAAVDKGIDATAARSEVQTHVETQQLRQQVAALENEKRQSVQQQMEAQILGAHMSRLRKEEAELKKIIPDFSLDKELNDPVTGKKFKDLTQPGLALGVWDAYRLIHWQEMEEANRKSTAEQSMAAVAASIAAGQQRPRENNPSAGGGVSQYTPYSQRSKEELKDIVKRAKRGEKIYYK